MTAKYGTPYFSNFINSDMEPSDVRSMCCRLRLDLRELRKKSGGFFGSGESTGSIGVVTINLPRIAYLATDEKAFYKRLDHMMDVAARSLDTKRTVITRLLDEGLYPYTKRYLGTFDNHFSTIGLIGMNEAALNANWLRKDLTDPEAQQFAKDVLNHMRAKLSDYQEQYGALFNLRQHPPRAQPTVLQSMTSAVTPTYHGFRIRRRPVLHQQFSPACRLYLGYFRCAVDSRMNFRPFIPAVQFSTLSSARSCPTGSRRRILFTRLLRTTVCPITRCPRPILSAKLTATSQARSTPAQTAALVLRYTAVLPAITAPVQNWNEGKSEEFRDRKLYDIDHSMIHSAKSPAPCEAPVETKAPEVSDSSKSLLFSRLTCPNCRVAESILGKGRFRI